MQQSKDVRRGAWRLGLLAGLMAAAPAMASGASVQDLFAQADATGDGRLDRQEMAQATARTSQVKLTAEALQIQRAVTMTFPMIDADGDGLISRQESLRYAAEAFKASDATATAR